MRLSRVEIRSTMPPVERLEVAAVLTGHLSDKELGWKIIPEHVNLIDNMC